MFFLEKLIIVLYTALDLYKILILISVLGTWVDPYRKTPIFKFVGKLTDPFLNLFRVVIPIGNMGLNISPVIGIAILELIREIISKIAIYIM